MIFADYVEQKKKEARLENINIVRQNIKTSEVQEKINNYVERFSNIFTTKEIEEGILTNNIIASQFCKDPSKQNISEKLAEEALGVPKLTASGKNCIRFDDNGNICHTASGHTKSADFLYNGFYATQKYTTTTGGHQDNQKNDVIDFLKRGSISYKVMAIIDGDYWDIHRSELEKLFQNNDNVKITSVTELSEQFG